MKLGVITGSGTHALPGFQVEGTSLERTSFGEVELVDGGFAGVPTVQVSRHGKGHERLSSHVNHRANISALAQRRVDAVLAVTVCGALDPALALGGLIVFDDLHFPSNRLPEGSLCSLFDKPGGEGRGHWVFEAPFSDGLRRALLDGAQDCELAVHDGGCYGHVDGPRFNSRSEIRALRAAGVSAVSQTAGPETVLAGEAELPYALTGYVTDYANGAAPEPTPVEELMRLLGASTEAFGTLLAAAVRRLAQSAAPAASGTVIRMD
jgi:purine nucleoside phosphorylase